MNYICTLILCELLAIADSQLWLLAHIIMSIDAQSFHSSQPFDG